MSQIVIVLLSGCVEKSECVGVVSDAEGDHVVVEHGRGVFLKKRNKRERGLSHAWRFV